MKNKYVIQSGFFLLGCLLEISSFACYDQTFSGYGTAVAYQGTFVDTFLDKNAQTNEGSAASPYGIVSIGTCFLNTTALPNYPTLGSMPSISRFNRDGTPDTNFGNFFPGTGSYIQDPSTNNAYPNFFLGSGQTGKLVYMNPSGLMPIYFLVYRNGNAGNSCIVKKYLPLTGRMDYEFNGNISLQDNLGNSIVATVTSACSVPVSGTAQTSPQTTSVMYVTYDDGSGNSYIAALTYVLASNSFVYDTAFATHGVIKFAFGTGGAGFIQFNSINYDSVANAGAGALLVSGVTGNGNVIIARYKNLTTTAVLDTSFNTTGYKIIAAPGGISPAFISQYIFSKIVSSGTHYYYLSGWNSGTNQIDICYFNPSTATFTGTVGTVSTIVSGNTYHIYDMAQISDFSNTHAVAVAVGLNISGQPTLAGIVDFQFEAPTLDLEGNAVSITQVNSQTALGQSGLDLSFYSCLFDPSLYAASPINLPGIFVGGNFGTPAYGCFINYTYSNSSHTLIPAVGVRTGTCLFDYVSSQYANGFSFEQVYYSSAGGVPSYYITGQAQDAFAHTYPGIFQCNITNNSFSFTL